MAVAANVQFRGLSLTGAYARIGNVFGGKHAGGQWGAVVNLFASSAQANPTSPAKGQPAPAPVALDSFNVYAPYVEGEDPYVSLYKALTAKLEADPNFSSVVAA